MDSDFNYYVAKERGRQITKNAFASFISEAGISSLIMYLLWDMFAHGKLLLWLLAAVTASLITFVFKLVFRSRTEFSPPRWYALILFCSVLQGSVWGIVPVLFFDQDNILFLAIVISFYTGCTSGGLVVNATYFPSFVAFGLAFSLPFIGSMIYQGEQPYTSIAIVATFHILPFLYISYNMQSLFLESAKIQFNRANLLDDLAQEKKAVEQAVDAKDRFLAAASHDLRQPLNAINLFMHALKPLQSKQSGDEIIDKVELSLKGLNSMLHSLLDIAELDADNVQNRPTHLSIYTLVESIVIEYQNKSSHLELLNEVDRDLIVFCDQTILYRVIRNLLDNAIKYTKQGQVIIECDARAESCVLYIRDSGIGIEQSQIDKVFTEFHQIDNPERDRSKGLGLGLSIVSRLCDLANIELCIESKLGHGTTVSLGLTTGVRTASNDNDVDRQASLAGLLVIVIDDDESIREAMELFLTAQHAVVISAESIEDTMRKLATNNHLPSLIISDYSLRNETTGTQAIECIREEYNRDIPAILITGDTLITESSEIQDLADYVLHKPIDINELQKSIADLIDPNTVN